MAQPNDQTIAVTTVEVGERRHLVEPYEERPLIELAKGTVACPHCGNGSFRRSRLRFTDLLELLMLRYPVRCTRCGKRQRVEVGIAFLAFPKKHVGPRRARGQETWQNWTSADAPVQTARPLSTAMVPKARKLESAARPAYKEPPARIPSRRHSDNSIW